MAPAAPRRPAPGDGDRPAVRDHRRRRGAPPRAGEPGRRDGAARGGDDGPGPAPRRRPDARLRPAQAAPARLVRGRPRPPARRRARSVLRQRRHEGLRRRRRRLLRSAKAYARRLPKRAAYHSLAGPRASRQALLRGHVEVNHVEKPHPRRRARRAARDPGAGRLVHAVAGGRSAAGRRLRLCHPDRRGRLDLSARARPARPGARPRAAGEDGVRRGGRRRPGLGAGDARPGRSPGREAGLRHQLRLPRAGAARRRRVSGGEVRARRRLQERAQPRHLRRPLLRGALARRLAGRAGEPERGRRLCRRLSGARGRAGHQRLHPRHARGEPEGEGAGAVAQHLVRPGQGARRRADADRPGRRRADPPQRLAGGGADRAGQLPHQGRTGRSLPERHARVRARCPDRRDRAPLGRLLHPRRRERARGHLEGRADVGRHRRRHGRHRRARSGPAGPRAQRRAEPAGRDRRRQPQALCRAAARQRGRSAPGERQPRRRADQDHGLVRRGRGRNGAEGARSPARPRAQAGFRPLPGPAGSPTFPGEPPRPQPNLRETR